MKIKICHFLQCHYKEPEYETAYSMFYRSWVRVRAIGRNAMQYAKRELGVSQQ
jgi:hypothetical protein